MNANLPSSFSVAEMPKGTRDVAARSLPFWLRGGAARFADGVRKGQLTIQFPDGAVRVFAGDAPGPEARLHVHRWRALRRLLVGGSVGWYQAWDAGDWSSTDKATLFAFFAANVVTLRGFGRAKGAARLLQRVQHWRHRNSRAGSRRNIAAHYDLGHDFYCEWLDPTLTYSSAIFSGPHDKHLEAAQIRKIDSVLGALELGAGQTLLEIGCGWGALGERAVKRHDVTYTGLTLSTDQLALTKQRLAGRGEVALRDYRDELGVYDAIASVEMIEAVGHSYWPTFADCVSGRLKPGGRALIQYIAIDDRLFEDYAAHADFIQTYIFPGGCLISETQFRGLCASRGLTWHQRERFGADYAKTLRLWRERFDAAESEGRLPARFDRHFCDMWRYYLDYCEGGFSGGSIWVGHVLLVKEG